MAEGIRTRHDAISGMWVADFGGGDEVVGTGATEAVAIGDLAMRDALEGILAALRADLETAQREWAAAGWPSAHITIARIAYERAIQTVESLA